MLEADGEVADAGHAGLRPAHLGPGVDIGGEPDLQVGSVGHAQFQHRRANRPDRRLRPTGFEPRPAYGVAFELPLADRDGADGIGLGRPVGADGRLLGERAGRCHQQQHR